MKPRALDRVLLVGFMGSGKTSVGRALARRLGWRFIDFDDAIAVEEGSSVAEIFATRGEPHFRAVEESVGRRLLAETNVVLASGGGWAASPGRLSGVPSGTGTFWLQVSAQEAIRRARATSGTRPLLAGPDPLGEASRLIAQRAPFYGEAMFPVDTERSSVEDVSATILLIIDREYPGVRKE